MFPSQNLYVFSFVLSITSSITQFQLQLTHLNANEPSLTVMYLRSDFQSSHLSLQIASARLSARFDNELGINLTLSMDFLFVCYRLTNFVFSFGWHQKSYILLCVLYQTFELTIKFSGHNHGKNCSRKFVDFSHFSLISVHHE